ncbi:MAG: hypothetical protein ACLQK4_01940 [Acidimicrobiales bacterium]
MAAIAARAALALVVGCEVLLGELLDGAPVVGVELVWFELVDAGDPEEEPQALAPSARAKRATIAVSRRAVRCNACREAAVGSIGAFLLREHARFRLILWEICQHSVAR